MNDPAYDGIHLTKEYYKDFVPTDLQWAVTKVDEDFTLYDLFHLVHCANKMVPGIFVTMGMLEFPKFWDQIQLDRDPDDVDNLEYLELYWGANYDTRTTPKTRKPTDQGEIVGLSEVIDDTKNYWDEPKICEMSNLMSFHGVGPGCPCKNLNFHKCDDHCPKETQYGIEFTPVNNLAHIPIRVLSKIEFFPPYVESDRDFHRTGFQLTIEPTLWCFITSIFWELTFIGSDPNEIADNAEEISGQIDEVKKHLKEQIDEEKDDDFLVS